MTLPTDTIESLRHQRNLLGEALGKVLISYGVIRADAALTGPELLLAAETAAEAAKPHDHCIEPNEETCACLGAATARVPRSAAVDRSVRRHHTEGRRMNIQVEADTTGFAPRDCRYSAIDSDRYDGAEDSRTRSTIGYGATPEAAIADLLALLTDDIRYDTDWLRERSAA